MQISEKVYRFCNKHESVSSQYANDSSHPPGHYADAFYTFAPPIITERAPEHERRPATKADLERARQCGNWGGSEPSELFLHCFHDALCALEHDPMAGVISPSLMGSNGYLPLTIISTIPDICRHMSNLIVRAEHEVFLATNFWIASGASRFITDALLELSKRAGNKGRRVTVKIMYDRGTARQVIDNHQIVSPETYTGSAVKLPAPEEIPYIDMEVQNYHRPALGTFHSKFMIVDRKYGVVQSNNIQDNDNLEMMTQIEGPIVDSLYDTAVIAWYQSMQPTLPLLYELAWNNESKPKVLFHHQDGPTVASESVKLPLHQGGDPHYDIDILSEIKRGQDALSPIGEETRMEAISRHLNEPTRQSYHGTASECRSEDDMTPMFPHQSHTNFPIALVNRRSWGAPNHQCVNVPQNEAWLSAIRHATSTIFIQTPNLNAEPLIPALHAALDRGIEVTYYVCLGYNDAGELLPFQGGTNEMVANKLCQSLSLESKKRLHVHYYVAKDQTRPIHNKFKARSCHIKLMIVDGHLGIQGNGNQDTQSWYHSMEVNIMIDSKQICGDWVNVLLSNQNTHIYGIASQEDGMWRDESGKEAEGAIGKDPGRFSWAKGVVGAVQRVRGAGGF
ncbi:phospholipase D/nuclease [Massarina eburnea CBS 473.64]|uniref:Phospholipase D/nuclease n=1 Tax=Massarina eburnea CBS 473.64 TaxID=1395130 RepID=A0A6A6RTD6_9PLEO|nr:phospholipase D/nuclease [Massarina eburnea CBS 473.64]